MAAVDLQPDAFPHYVREAAHRASTSVIKIIGHYHQFARAGSLPNGRGCGAPDARHQPERFAGSDRPPVLQPPKRTPSSRPPLPT